MTSDLPLDPLIYRALHTGTLGDLAFYRDLVQRALEASEPDVAPTVLELGCGAGRLALPLWSLGAHVVGGIIENSGEGVVRRHWTGDADVIAATAAILNDAPAMLGDVLWGKLKALVE